MSRLTLRAKITIWYTLVLFVVLSAFGLAIYFLAARTLYVSVEMLAKTHASQAESMIEFENNHFRIGEPQDLNKTGTRIKIFDAENQLIFGENNGSAATSLEPAFNRSRRVEIGGVNRLIFDKPVYQQGKIMLWIRADRSLEPTRETVRNLGFLILFAIPACLIAAIVGGLFISNRALAPIKTITETASAVGRGDLSQRLKIPRIDDEVGGLAAVFDEMLDKLEASFKRERQFTSDASHELRTPVAVISAEAQEALTGDRGVEELRAALGNIAKAGRRMELLIAQLLELTRADEKKSGLVIEKIDLKRIAEEVIAELETAGEKRGIQLHLTAAGNIEMEGDQALITNLLINLVDNAINYNKPGGRVTVGLFAQDHVAKIFVEDQGIGIAPEHQLHIFDRFYRVDKARSGGGTGLGLSIAKWIVEAHRGSISVESELDAGTVFTVTLPMLPDA